MILDTSFLIDVMNGRSIALEYVEQIEGDGVTQRIPAQVVYELFVGLGYTNQTERERSKIESVLSTRSIVETTAPIARLAGRMDGRLRRQGDRLGSNDIVVGATARHLDEPVVTSDRDDFGRLPQVELAAYASN